MCIRAGDDSVQLRFHAGHGVDLTREGGHEERIHHRRRRDFEADRAVDRRGQLIYVADALIGVEEQPFPVQRHPVSYKNLTLPTNSIV